MNRIIYAAGVAAALLVAGAAHAQTVAPPAPVATLAPVAEGTILRVGTKVPLKMAEELTTKGKKLRVGYHFRMETAEDISLSGQVVIPAGTPAVGEVTEVRNKGMWGKSGHITAQMLYLRVGDRQIRLSGTFDDKGVTGTAGVVGAVAFVPVAGFFVTGTSAKIPLGGAVTGFLNEDVPVVLAPVVVAPIQAVPPAAPASSN